MHHEVGRPQQLGMRIYALAYNLEIGGGILRPRENEVKRLSPRYVLRCAAKVVHGPADCFPSASLRFVSAPVPWNSALTRFEHPQGPGRQGM